MKYRCSKMRSSKAQVLEDEITKTQRVCLDVPLASQIRNQKSIKGKTKLNQEHAL